MRGCGGPEADLVGADVRDVPRVLRDIQEDWRNKPRGTISLNRLTAWNLSRCLRRRLDRRVAGTSKSHRSVDVVVTGCEVSLWLAEQFAASGAVGLVVDALCAGAHRHEPRAVSRSLASWERFGAHMTHLSLGHAPIFMPRRDGLKWCESSRPLCGARLWMSDMRMSDMMAIMIWKRLSEQGGPRGRPFEIRLPRTD